MSQVCHRSGVQGSAEALLQAAHAERNLRGQFRHGPRMRRVVAHEFDRVRDRQHARGRRGSCKRDANQTADRAPAQPGSTTCGEHTGNLLEASECRQKRFKWSSFSHHIQLHLTRIDRVGLKAVNRPAPCKHKGIREFSEIFGITRVKARTLQGVAGSNPVSMTKCPGDLRVSGTLLALRMHHIHRDLRGPHRRHGKGPAPCPVGKHLKLAVPDLRAWIAQQAEPISESRRTHLRCAEGG